MSDQYHEDVCQVEIHQLKQELEHFTSKSKQLKQNYQKLLIENLQKDLIIRELKQQINIQKFDSFEGKLSEQCLEQIKTIGDSPREDSAFFNLILTDIYGDSLQHKTLSGRSEISRGVKMFLNDIFAARINHLPYEEKSGRREHLNRCIRNAIDKAKRQQNGINVSSHKQ